MANSHDYTGHLARIDERLADIETAKIGERLATIEANQAHAKDDRVEMKSDTKAILRHMEVLPCSAQEARMVAIEGAHKTRSTVVNDQLRNLRTMFWSIVAVIIASAIGILVAAGKIPTP